ncbi:YodC family protein [Luteolibacter sp. AS25]|uniref:YodC family protein n=1 Tax=Luteolibacter sp. AS25 TaxID=3135776 RepID=UPI00398AF3BC
MSKTTKFNKGDTVTLKSGGPVMTVKGEKKANLRSDVMIGYYCQWFAGKKLEQGDFPPESLKLAADEDSK